jgi:hypothetical protein
MIWIVKQVWQHAARCDIEDYLLCFDLRYLFAIQTLERGD